MFRRAFLLFLFLVLLAPSAKAIPHLGGEISARLAFCAAVMRRVAALKEIDVTKGSDVAASEKIAEAEEFLRWLMGSAHAAKFAHVVGQFNVSDSALVTNFALDIVGLGPLRALASARRKLSQRSEPLSARELTHPYFNPYWIDTPLSQLVSASPKHLTLLKRYVWRNDAAQISNSTFALAVPRLINLYEKFLIGRSRFNPRDHQTMQSLVDYRVIKVLDAFHDSLARLARLVVQTNHQYTASQLVTVMRMLFAYEGMKSGSLMEIESEGIPLLRWLGERLVSTDQRSRGIRYAAAMLLALYQFRDLERLLETHPSDGGAAVRKRTQLFEERQIVGAAMAKQLHENFQGAKIRPKAYFRVLLFLHTHLYDTEQSTEDGEWTFPALSAFSSFYRDTWTRLEGER